MFPVLSLLSSFFKSCQRDDDLPTHLGHYIVQSTVGGRVGGELGDDIADVIYGVHLKESMMVRRAKMMMIVIMRVKLGGGPEPSPFVLSLRYVSTNFVRFSILIVVPDTETYLARLANEVLGLKGRWPMSEKTIHQWHEVPSDWIILWRGLEGGTCEDGKPGIYVLTIPGVRWFLQRELDLDLFIPGLGRRDFHRDDSDFVIPRRENWDSCFDLVEVYITCIYFHVLVFLVFLVSALYRVQHTAGMSYAYVRGKLIKDLMTARLAALGWLVGLAHGFTVITAKLSSSLSEMLAAT
jgi:hypothetical protein